MNAVPYMAIASLKAVHILITACGQLTLSSYILFVLCIFWLSHYIALACHINNASVMTLHVLLSLQYNCIIIDGFLPNFFMETIKSPVVKDKGNVTYRNNHRHILK